jgi:myb proto-oncogene protein
MVPGRKKNNCHSIWHDALDPRIALTAGSTGKWTEDEDLKVKATVQSHGGMDWATIATMVPGRTEKQCSNRWHNGLDPRIALKAGSTCQWTEDEGLKLKAAVHMHGARIGPQLPHWFLLERKSSVGIDGRITGTLIVAQSGGKNTA